MLIVTISLIGPYSAIPCGTHNNEGNNNSKEKTERWPDELVPWQLFRPGVGKLFDRWATMGFQGPDHTVLTSHCIPAPTCCVLGDIVSPQAEAKDILSTCCTDDLGAAIVSSSCTSEKPHSSERPALICKVYKQRDWEQRAGGWQTSHAAVPLVFVTVLFHAADWNEPKKIFEVLTVVAGWPELLALGVGALWETQGFAHMVTIDMQRWCVFKWKEHNR